MGGAIAFAGFVGYAIGVNSMPDSGLQNAMLLRAQRGSKMHKRLEGIVSGKVKASNFKVLKLSNEEKLPEKKEVPVVAEKSADLTEKKEVPVVAEKPADVTEKKEVPAVDLQGGAHAVNSAPSAKKHKKH